MRVKFLCKATSKERADPRPDNPNASLSMLDIFQVIFNNQQGDYLNSVLLILWIPESGSIFAPEHSALAYKHKDEDATHPRLELRERATQEQIYYISFFPDVDVSETCGIVAPGTFRIPEEDFNQYDKIYDASSAGQNKKFFTRHVYAIQPENDDFSIARMHEALKQLMDTVRENHSGALDDNALRFLRADLTIEEANAVTMIFPYGRHDSGGYLNNNKNFYKLCYCIGCQPCCSQPPNWMQQFRCFFPRHNCTSLILYLLEQGGLTTDLSFWPTWLSIFSQLIISAIFGFTLGETIHLFTSKQTGKPYDEVFGVAACIISAMTFFADLFHHCSQPSRSISQSLYCGMSVKSSAMMFLKTSVTMALISTTLFVAFIIARVADREEVVEESDKRELKFGTIGLAVGLFGATSLKTIMACMNHRQTGCVRPTNVLSILKRMTMFSTQGDEMATSLAPDDAVRLPLI